MFGAEEAGDCSGIRLVAPRRVSPDSDLCEAMRPTPASQGAELDENRRNRIKTQPLNLCSSKSELREAEFGPETWTPSSDVGPIFPTPFRRPSTRAPRG